MATNLALDDRLIESAQRAGGHKTKKEAVTTALREYVRRSEQLRIFGLAGKVEYYPDHDHKVLRRRGLH